MSIQSNLMQPGAVAPTNPIQQTQFNNPMANSGRVIGNAKLSEEGEKYYEELKKKFSNFDFVLVSEDQKDYAKSHVSQFMNPNKPICLINEEKIERMATDEKYRKQYESIIEKSSVNLNAFKSSVEGSGMGGNVKGYGINVKDDGTTEFFAVMQKSADQQRARIEKHHAEKKAAEKKAEKRAQHEKWEEKLQHRDNKEEAADIKSDTERPIMITAGSIDELMKKISDYNMNLRTDSVRTEEEKQLGQNIDYRG